MTATGLGAGVEHRPAARVPANRPEPDAGDAAVEHRLAARVLEALIREGYAGLAGRVRQGPRGPRLRLPGGAGGPGGRARGLPGRGRVPLRPDGLLADHRVPAAARLTLDDVLAALAAVHRPGDAAGAAAFARECREALAGARLLHRLAPAVAARLAALAAADPAAVRGPRGLLWYDTLAAGADHPLYPTSRCRLGFGPGDLLGYAPEFGPGFALAWAAVPRARLVRRGGPAPPWWPTPELVGLPARLARDHDLVPVHPFTAARTGQPVAPVRHLRVIPTLSVRTVAVAADPAAHLKLPLAASTLGLRNRRTIELATLADGALVQHTLARIRAADPELAHRLLLTREGDYAHAGVPTLAYLLRRLPAGLDRLPVVGVAALAAPGPAGGTVLEAVAAAAGIDPVELFGRYLEALFAVHVRLFVRYGIALEAHQQNTALVVDPAGVRLLVKDNDSPLIRHARLAAALPGAPPPGAFADRRLLTGSEEALVKVFVTIVVHLCAAAPAGDLAARGVAPLPRLLGLVRAGLAAALAGHAGLPPARLLRARLLGAPRLPHKAMVTAATLVDKARTGAADVNKHYGASGPNYLLPRSSRRWPR